MPRLIDRATVIQAAGNKPKIIDEFIRYAKGFPKVWFARRIEIANWCLEKGY